MTGRAGREVFANEITDRLAANDPVNQEIKKSFKTPVERIPALEKWLETKAQNPAGKEPK